MWRLRSSCKQIRIEKIVWVFHFAYVEMDGTILNTDIRVQYFNINSTEQEMVTSNIQFVNSCLRFLRRQ